jgi:hypothetical protein
MNIKEINSAIMHGNVTNEELNSIVDAVRFARAQLVIRNKRSLVVGCRVKFTGTRAGTVVGVVRKINRKLIVVDDPVKFSSWKVPANMLEIV